MQRETSTENPEYFPAHMFCAILFQVNSKHDRASIAIYMSTTEQSHRNTVQALVFSFGSQYREADDHWFNEHRLISY